jgi:hypothetical protein
MTLRHKQACAACARVRVHSVSHQRVSLKRENEREPGETQHALRCNLNTAAGPACSTTGADARVAVAPLCNACSACAGDDADGVDEAGRDSIDCIEVATVAGCARGAGVDSESTAGEGEEGAALRSDTAGSAEEGALTRIGRASADASLPIASVRWGAWLLMPGSAVGTVGVRACVPARPSGSVAGWANRPCLITNLLPTRLDGRPLSGKRRVCVQRTVGGARSRYGRDFLASQFKQCTLAATST